MKKSFFQYIVKLIFHTEILMIQTKLQNMTCRICTDNKFETPKDLARPRLKAIQNKETGIWLHAFPQKILVSYFHG